MSKKIAVVGSNMVDLVTYVNRMPIPGETLEAPSFEIGCGGKGANQAVAAARLGAEVMIVTCVGDDVFADNTISNLKQIGIDTRHVHKVTDKSSGVAPIFVEPNGENAILIIKGANSDLSPTKIERAASDLKSCRLILMQMEVPLETIYHTIKFAADNGIETILNPAPAVADLDLERIQQLTFIVPNESELAILSGMPTQTDDDIVAAARTLIARGIQTVIVTLGGRGARMITASEDIYIEPAKVTPKDTTGAGDAFIGAFAHFYVASGEVQTALHKAALYAAHSITRTGTQKSYASQEEFEVFCRDYR